MNSNHIKTQAFREVAGRFGESKAEALVEYHVNNGGVSRYRKFEYFLQSIVGRDYAQKDIDELAGAYGECVLGKLMTCGVATGLPELRNSTAGIPWMIISGGDQSELRRVFGARGLDELFDGGIFGSPATKDELLASGIATGRIKLPALFIGDSRYDHQAASTAGCDFLFVSGWTEFCDWESYCENHGISTISSVGELSRSLLRSVS